MNKKAFTFVELIAATLIVAILSAGVFGAFTGAFYIFNRSMHKMQAYNFARDALDRLRSNYNYNDSQMAVGNGHKESEISSVIKGEMLALGATLTYDVSYDLPEAEPDGYKKVKVHINWNERAFR